MDTRERLLLTAERLMGERGINGVSLREITREAGQKNASALHYHFGSRDGLIEAIFEKRMRALDVNRMKLLDRMEREGRLDNVRCVAEAVSLPTAELLDSTDGGGNYIKFLTEMFLSTDANIEDFVRGRLDGGLRRSFDVLKTLLPDLPESVLRQRFIIMMRAGTFALADIDVHRKRMEEAGRPFDMQRAIGTLIDMWVGGISAPLGSTEAKTTGREAA
ncbi:MAG: TetR/AcrR family transcriptional regulator [Minwuia sp.]|nr:TetR/AcrR family transcriptional regulator [Minwuia sp.]